MNYKDKKIVVMGLGSFGGGIGVVRWLHAQGAQVQITDLSPIEELESSIQELQDLDGLEFVLGEHRETDFESADVVIANPAIPMPMQNKYLQIAMNARVEITSEICLLTKLISRENVIGVTGSAGKSTTASMIFAALAQAGIPSWLGGNIGGSLLGSVEQMQSGDIIVLELSSAMLWWLNQQQWSPHVAVLTNIEPNHLDWHGSFEEYQACKEYIFANQTQDDIAIRNCETITFEDLLVPGKHNEQNASFALRAAMSVGADEQKARVGICNFQGLPHRLERIAENVFNDSKSTTPTATKLAVDTFANPSQIHLIVGGYDKKSELSLIAEQSARVSCLYTIGTTGDVIASLASGKVQSCQTLDVAIQKAKENMKAGDVLLLSPGCASWDQFKNYEERGDMFASLVKQ